MSVVRARQFLTWSAVAFSAGLLFHNLDHGLAATPVLD